ncbi:hypothetical protein KIH77_08685 [Bifidobacterium sp. 82T24]|uniref:hypothetical protein n=1 Tax=Bifidobacterium pluvialisilvae TaxID=2834436 RepID=UPI001C59BA68|nr:hypothetical protein [Bifidobacterium pluvialisilvae]MBW3088798.1 hypothetical protein [Bifidobacterium pluvialisilvae]
MRLLHIGAAAFSFMGCVMLLWGTHESDGWMILLALLLLSIAYLLLLAIHWRP